MSTFAEIAEKCRNRIRLTEDDAINLYRHDDILELGALADEVNKRKNHDQVFYNINRHINPTNVCAKSCKFCAFSRKPGEEGAYEYTMPEILQRAEQALNQGATEIHMVGGLHPRWPFARFLEIISTIKQHYPTLHIKAFTAVEIDWLAAKARLSLKDTLLALKGAGLDSMPGGGAEIFHPEIREKICDTKTDANRWIEIHRTAHQLGLRSNCTMLYGHIENNQHRVDHMRRLRDLQDETSGFNVFIPLAFQPYDNDMGITRYTAGIDDLRTIAVARLYLDNFKNIKAYWIMLGQEISQLALHFGANDLDGTVTEEKISRMAGGQAGMAMSRSQIEAIIYKAQRQAQERDTLYNPVKRPSDVTKPVVVHSEDAEQAASLILYKAEKGEFLNAEQAAKLVDPSTSLFQLGHCARIIKSALNHQVNGFGLAKIPASTLMASDDSGAVLKPQILALDIDAEEFNRSLTTCDSFCNYIREEKATTPSRGIAIFGLKGLWTLARRFGLPINDLLSRLSEAGVDTLESSHHETEIDLTAKEVIALHRACHQVDINTVGKVEIMATYSGKESPFWEEFIKRILEFRVLQTETGGMLALKIEAAKDSFVTPYEYLRGLALARILSNNIPHILAPFRRIPLIKQRGTDPFASAKDPALKIAPLTLYFGASDLGVLPSDHSEPLGLIDELKISGLPAVFRDTHFSPVNIL